jgi:peptidoglycan/LPS O-acetylase OafA/YrhL
MVDMGHFCNPFVNIDGYWHADVFKSGYLLVLWTIPIEFRGSLVVFLFCIAACKLSTRGRMSLCWLIILICFYWTTTYVALFLGGMFLADLSFTRHPERLGTSAPLPQITSEKTPRPQPQSLRHRILYASLLIIAIFLLCQPTEELSAASWPWPQLESLIPSKFRASPNKEHWWLSIGSLILVFALDSSPTLQTPLKWNFSQYLGELSFGIYVMHLLVLWCLWWPHLNKWRLSLLGEEMWTYAPFLVLFYAAILWAADLFCRIDGKIVAFGRWLQDKLFEW